AVGGNEHIEVLLGNCTAGFVVDVNNDVRRILLDGLNCASVAKLDIGELVCGSKEDSCQRRSHNLDLIRNSSPAHRKEGELLARVVNEADASLMGYFGFDIFHETHSRYDFLSWPFDVDDLTGLGA
ncbi:MAG: hypothetical protein LQ349_008802, partial [Xanthoria aureola]